MVLLEQNMGQGQKGLGRFILGGLRVAI